MTTAPSSSIHAVFVTRKNRARPFVVRHLRSGGYTVTCTLAATPDALRKTLIGGAPDVIFFDDGMRDMSVAQAVALMRELSCDVPLIFVCDAVQQSKVVTAMQAGACDYVSRATPWRLMPILERERREMALRHAKRAAEDSARKLEMQVRASQRLEAVGQLTGGIAHDFNNLLTAILSFGRFALEALEPDNPAIGDVREVVAAANRAEGLTGRLLAFSRKRSVKPIVLNANVIVRRMQRMLHRLVGDNIAFVVELNADLWECCIDETGLEQVVVNLIVNARDALPRGGHVRVKTHNVTLASDNILVTSRALAPGAYAELIVEDDGIGMPPEVREAIFEPFFTTKEGSGGTGLGLSTSQNIIKKAGGTIHAESRPGLGTRFHVYLPRALQTSRTRATTQTRPILRGQETILIVEDDEQVRRLSYRSLARMGYNVLVATDGESGISQAKSHVGPIHLLLTDVVMPTMSGFYLAACIGRSRPDIKALYMSGYTSEIDRHKDFLGENCAFLQKPFVPDTLAQQVRHVLDTPSSFLAMSTQQPRILFIDDDVRFLRAISLLFKKDYHVVVAHDGAAALDIIGGSYFDLIFCDLVMPTLSGADLLRTVQNKFPFAAQRIVFVTGVPDAIQRYGLDGEGGPIVLEKPLDQDRLHELIRDLRTSEAVVPHEGHKNQQMPP